MPHRMRLEDWEEFFALSLDMLCIAGTDGYFKLLNPAWQRTLGWTPGELMARPWVDFVHPDDREATFREGARIREGCRSVAFRNRYLCKNGSYKDLRWNAQLALCGELIYATARDITRARHTEETLRAANEKLELQLRERTEDLRAAGEALRARAARAAPTEPFRENSIAPDLPADLAELLRCADRIEPDPATNETFARSLADLKHAVERLKAALGTGGSRRSGEMRG